MKEIETYGTVRDELEKRMLADREMNRLKARYADAVRSMRYADAEKVRRKIEQREEEIARQLVKRYDGQRVRMYTLMGDMSIEDRDTMNELANCVILFSDMIETFTMDSNEILHRYHPDCHIEMFDRLIEVGKEAKAQMKFMSDETDILYQNEFAVHADKLTEMVLNKAKSMLKHIKAKEKIKHEKCKKQAE